jgi:3-isopropylmalate/(R)-2-methylmalate dehydratase large subunit
MTMTVAEKILARGSGRDAVRPGDLVTVEVDTAVVLDMNFVPGNGYEVLALADPARVIVMHDHLAPARDVQAADAMSRGRRFVEKWNIERFHDVGYDGGIAHQIIADHAYSLPGEIIVCSDSHTCSAGVLNSAGRGLGAPEFTYALCKGTSWFQVGETIRYEFVGALPPHVYAKDVFLMLAERFGSHAGQNIEYGGAGMANLSLDARRTLSAMGAELSAEFAIWEPDEVLLDYVRARARRPFVPAYPDAGADYLDVREIVLDEAEPFVGLPHALIHNTVPISALPEPVPIQQCFIGSCANGTLDDIASAAAILSGRRIARSTRLVITPGSQHIYREAVRLGYVEALSDAGALVTPAGCGACGGISMGLVGAGETCLTSSTRNFKGRMGSPEASIYMASSATVAASALTGVITDPRTAVADVVTAGTAR